MGGFAEGVDHSAEEILAALPDCTQILSAAGIVKFTNESGIDFLRGAAGANMYGTSFAELWPAELRESVMDAVRGATRGEQTRVEGYLPTILGTPRWCETRFRAIEATSGAGVEVIGVTRDISLHRSSELLARAQEERLALFLRFAPGGICETDPDGRCLFINSAGAGMLGYKPAELIGQPLHEIVHHSLPDGRPYPATECPLFAALETRVPVRANEEVFWRKDGRPVPLIYSAYPLDSPDRKGGAILTFDDASEHRRVKSDLRKIAAELADANRRTTEFIATLAHELRNPLAPIRTGLQLMRKAGDSAQVIKGVREMMERQVGQMVHLIGDLLDIARVTSGKIELRKERLALRAMVESALETSAALMTEHEHSVLIELSPEPLEVVGDPVRLTQILTNLLNNAAKYTPPRGKISIKTRRDGDRVDIEVADSGAGISGDALEIIFEMFTKVERGSEPEQGGLGIGLNLVRRMVEMHGGRVVAHSEGLDRGSRFVVTLPLAPADVEGSAAVERPTVAREAVKVRILLVDDNVDAVATLAMLLELEHHTTCIAHSGAEALAVVKQFKPDIIFLDIGMPEMSGYEVAKAIRAMPDVGNPVLVALTGWGGESDRIQSKSAGFDEHLTKPADISVIESLLARIEQPRAPHH